MSGRSPLAGDEPFVVTGAQTGAPQAPTATLSADGRTITHARGPWSESYPVATLMSRLKFYKSMSETTMHTGYKEDARVLGGLAREIKRRAELARTAAAAPPPEPAAAEDLPSP